MKSNESIKNLLDFFYRRRAIKKKEKKGLDGFTPD